MFCVEVAIDYVQWKKYAMQESQLKRKNYLDQGQQWSLRQVNKNKQTNKHKMEEQLLWTEIRNFINHRFIIGQQGGMAMSKITFFFNWGDSMHVHSMGQTTNIGVCSALKRTFHSNAFCTPIN